MIDWQQTVLTEYLKDPVMASIFESWNESIDPSAYYDEFYDSIWNVDTAVGYGLDLWGRIVGVGRVLQLGDQKYFGFAEATTLSADPYNQSPFYSGQPLTSNYALTDAGFRTLIYAKALANISDNSVPSVNRILMTLFAGRGNAWVADNGGMQITYTFSFLLTPVESAIVTQSGVLPKGTGVKVLYNQIGS